MEKWRVATCRGFGCDEQPRYTNWPYACEKLSPQLQRLHDDAAKSKVDLWHGG